MDLWRLKMIDKINKRVENNELVVEVLCNVRRYAKYPINELTTEDLIDIIKKEYNITSVKSKPAHPVGNSERRKMQLSGTWVFTIKEETVQDVKEEEKPKTTRQRKPKTATKPATKAATKAAPKTSIRSRMSTLAKE